MLLLLLLLLLLLMRLMWLLLVVGGIGRVLRTLLRHSVLLHVLLVLRSVDGGIGHKGIAVDRLLLRGRWWLLLLSYPANVLSGGRARSHLGLGCVAARSGLARVLLEVHAVDGRRGRWLVMPHVGEARLALEVRRQHLGLHGLADRRGAVVVFLFLLVVAAVEV